MSDLDKQIAARVAKAVQAAAQDNEALKARKRKARKAADEAYKRVMDEDEVVRAKTETEADKERIQAQCAPPPDEDGLMAQSTPKDEDVDGRSSCAKAIRATLRKGPIGDEIERHFSAAEQNNMVKTLADTEVEMRQTAHTERYLGNHVSLSDPYGDTLRKGGAPISTAMDTLRKLRSGYLFEQMAKSRSLRPGALQKALGNTVSRRNTLLIKGVDGITRELELGTNAPKLPTVLAIAKALRHPQSYDPSTFFKGRDTLPPQDADSEDDEEIADTGAVNDWSSQGQTANSVRADLMVGREHAASLHDLRRAPRVIGDDEVAVPSDASRSSRERSLRMPTARPAPRIQTRAQNPNADDSGSSETVEAIKEAQRHPKPLWG